MTNQPKYTMGVDLANGEAITVYGHWLDGIYYIDDVIKGDPTIIIDGTAVEVETRPERLLAGGSES